MSGPHDLTPLDMDMLSPADRNVHERAEAVAMFREVIESAKIVARVEKRQHQGVYIGFIITAAQQGLDALGVE